MVLTSRSVPSRIWERMPVLLGGGDVVLWSKEEESQDWGTAGWNEGAGGAAAGVGMGVLCGFVGALAF